MATTGNIFTIDDAHIAIALQEAASRLERDGGELILDFSCVHRLDAGAVRALEKLAGISDGKSLKVVLRGLNIDLYRTLKLMKLTHRFSFVE